MLSKELSNKFANMALFCAVLVAFIHLPKPNTDCARYIWGMFSHGFAKIAVPFFFVSAGFWLSRKFEDNGWYAREVLKRVKTLIVPLIFWDLLWYFYSPCLSVVCNILCGRSWLENVHLNVSLVECLKVFALWPFSQPELGVLWFVRVLFLLVVLSPVLRKISSLPVILCLWILHGLIHPDYGVQCSPVIFTLQEGFFSVFGVVYFCLGIYLSRNVGYLSFSRRGGVILLSIGVILLCLRGMPYTGIYSRVVSWMMTPFLMFGVFTLMPTMELPNLLKSMSFPIYVLHMFVIVTIGIVYKYTNSAGYVLRGVLTVVLCCVTAFFLRKAVPRISALIFGGR